MMEISIRCTGCNRAYTLGRDAAVVTGEGVQRDFAQVIRLGRERYDVPDLIASLPRSWSSLDPSTVREQEIAIRQISSSLEARQWRCQACGAVQPYRLLPGPVDTEFADLTHPDPKVRAAAVERLGESRTTLTHGPLLTALADGNPQVRQAAACALGKVGDLAATLTLKTVAVHDPDDAVRKEAASALRSLERLKEERDSVKPEEPRKSAEDTRQERP